MALLSWHIVTQAEYDAGVKAKSLKEDAIYFLSDTRKVMKGSGDFTESVRFYTGTKPTAPAQGVVYINSTTLKGEAYNGSAWVTVIEPVVNTITDTDTTSPVTGKAVADYVKGKFGGKDTVKAVSYDKEAVALNVTTGDGKTQTAVLENIGVSIDYTGSTGDLVLKDKNDKVLSTVKLALERFVKSATYSAENHEITLVFNDDQDAITIDVSDLVDTYTVGNTGSVTMTMTGNNITATVKKSASDKNILEIKADGLYVPETDISGKVDKVGVKHDDEIMTADATGNAKASGVKAGGETLAAKPNAKTLATEAAVEAIRVALQANVDAASTKVDNTAKTLREELVAKTSIVKSGSISEDAASDEKVISEKALVDALTWKTTI